MNFLYKIIGYPFGFLMELIYNIIGNYGVSIIVFTIVTKLILFPVNYKTQKDSARMKLLNPKIAKLKKSYSNNPTKLQEEQQKLYQQEGVNPMASCLPTFVQFFVLFGVIDVVYKPFSHILRFSSGVKEKAVSIASSLSEAAGGKSIGVNDLRNELLTMEQVMKYPEKFSEVGENFLDKVMNFSDNFTLFGVNLGITPDFSPETWNKQAVILFLIPFASGIIQLISTIYMQINQKKSNPDMANMGCMSVMLYLMPIMSVWIAFQVPAGVGFYWIWSSLFSFLITLGLNRYFTEERTVKINEKEKEKARIYAEKHPQKKTFMQKMLEQQQALEQQQNGSGSRNDSNGAKISRSEMNKYNRDRINEARKRMAEKYGDEYDDNNNED